MSLLPILRFTLDLRYLTADSVHFTLSILPLPEIVNMTRIRNMLEHRLAASLKKAQIRRRGDWRFGAAPADRKATQLDAGRYSRLPKVAVTSRVTATALQVS